METVKELLAHKESHIWSVTPDSSVYDALSLMAEKGVGAVLVIENDELCGILSERDYARKVVLADRASRSTLVNEIMTSRVVFVEPTQTVDDCMALMTDKHIRHLPVMENDKVVGVLSIGDLVRAVIAEQQFVISQLENYISS